MKKLLKEETKQISAGGVATATCPECGAEFTVEYSSLLNVFTFGLTFLNARTLAIAEERKHVYSFHAGTC